MGIEVAAPAARLDDSAESLCLASFLDSGGGSAFVVDEDRAGFGVAAGAGVAIGAAVAGRQRIVPVCPLWPPESNKVRGQWGSPGFTISAPSELGDSAESRVAAAGDLEAISTRCRLSSPRHIAPASRSPGPWAPGEVVTLPGTCPRRCDHVRRGAGCDLLAAGLRCDNCGQHLAFGCTVRPDR